MDIQRIRTDVVAGSKPILRNRNRVVLEVDVIPQNGKILYGRLCPQGVSRVEVYDDEIDGVLAKLRTKKAEEAYELAKVLAHGYREEWASENRERRQMLEKMTPEERAKFIDMNANIRPEQFVAAASGGALKRGMGSLRSVNVLGKDEETVISVPEFRALSDEDRRKRFLIDPPHTEQNAIEIAASVQSTVLAQVVAELQKQNATQNGELIAALRDLVPKQQSQPQGKR